MTIIRGYSFQPDELVTNEKLHNLVLNAQFTNINWGALVESGSVVPQTTSASGTSVTGQMWAEYEQIDALETSSYSGQWRDYSYFVQAPAGAVALFRQNGLEARHFFQTDAVTNINPGSFCMPGDTNPSTGVTLGIRAAWGAAGQPHRNPVVTGIGATWTPTTVTTPTGVLAWPRVSLAGLSIVKLSNQFVTPTLSFPAYLNMDGIGGQVSKFTSSSTTVAFYAFGVLLEHKRNGGGIGWLFGGPVERTG